MKITVYLRNQVKWVGSNYAKSKHRKQVAYVPREPNDPTIERTPRLGPKRKVACLIGYDGTGYNGLQINPPYPTIEAELYKAFVEAGGVSKDNAADLKKSGFKRCARTDKGVHAAGNVISLKMVIPKGEENMEEVMKDKINERLPASIRIWAIQRVNKGFDCKNMCGSRVYQYWLPTYVFRPPNPISPMGKIAKNTDGYDIPANEYRISPSTLENVKESFKIYEGTHNYHNFTPGVDYHDPKSSRYINDVSVSDPVIRESTEWISINLHGQSFMLHQIRKMVCMVALVIRAGSSLQVIVNSFKENAINIPPAPALGLLLDHPVFDGFNRQLVDNFGYKPIDFAQYSNEIDNFKDHVILKRIFKEENTNREYENFFNFVDYLEDSENSPGRDFHYLSAVY